MKCLAICNKGFEDICSLEIKELIEVECKELDSCVEFEANDEQMAKLSYLSQSINRLLILFDKFKFGKTDFNFDIKLFNKKTFCVRHIKQDSEIDGCKLESEIGAIMFKKLKSKVDLEKPDITVIAFINGNDIFLGADFCGYDLGKRSYKIYLTPKSLKGTLAYSLMRYSGYDISKVFLDCFANNGIIPIETVLFTSGFSVRNFDKDKFKFISEDFDLSKFDVEIKKDAKVIAFDHLLPNIEKMKKNAKIAGIQKLLKPSKVDVEWLDTKLDENSVDIICSQFIELSKRTAENIVKKTYKEFFYQAEFILKKKGIVVALLHHPELLIEFAEKSKFKVIEKREIYSGKDKLVAVKLQLE